MPERTPASGSNVGRAVRVVVPGGPRTVAATGRERTASRICARRITASLVGWLVLTLSAAVVAQGRSDSLYEGRAIVTGQGEANRVAGFAQCLEDVLVKLSGDPRLIDDPRVQKLGARAGTLVSAFRYRDVLEGKPIHDEQGTYDRPHYLTATFDIAKTDALLRSLGREPWLAVRPRVTVFLAVNGQRADFVLAEDGDTDRSADMRAAFAAASERIAIPIALARQSELEAAGLTVETLPTTALQSLVAIAGASGGDDVLAGSMMFSDKAFGWIVTWRFAEHHRDHTWQVSGVNFDEAFRNGLRGVAQILSGNGEPDRPGRRAQ